MSVEDLINKLDNAKRDSILLECMVSILAQNKLIYKLLYDIKNEGDTMKMIEFELNNKYELDISASEVLHELYAKYGITPTID